MTLSRVVQAAFIASVLGITPGQTVQASETALSDRIMGSWVCHSGVCWDEEIAFSEVDGVRSYDSWTHARPMASGGTWALNGDRLAIACCAGIEYDYVVVRVTDGELVLRDADTDEETVFKRVGTDPAPTLPAAEE